MLIPTFGINTKAKEDLLVIAMPRVPLHESAHARFDSVLCGFFDTLYTSAVVQN